MCLLLAIEGTFNSLKANRQMRVDHLLRTTQSKRAVLATHEIHNVHSLLQEDSPREVNATNIQNEIRDNPGVKTNAMQFRFQSVTERIEYYMGSWINVTNLNRADLRPEYCTKDILNGGSNPGVVIMGLNDISACVDDGRSVLGTYCREVLPMVVDTSMPLKRPSAHSLMVLMRPSDGVKNWNYPLVVKARLSHGHGLDTESSNILWPFMVHRHYSRLFDASDRKHLHNIPWEEKKDTLVWRGAPTGDRLNIVEKLFEYNLHDIDVAFHISSKGNNKLRDEKTHGLVRDSMSLAELVRYKFLLSIEGNDVASGLKWMLYSNSVVFMSRPTSTTWAMEDKLRPFIHYIPIDDDGGNLPEMLQWARSHQEDCRRISGQATDFVHRLLVSEQAQRDNELILSVMSAIYQRRFGRSLYEYCHGGVKETTTT